VFASVVAIWAAELGSLIEVVNRFGSFFYGSILGVFILAIGWPRANGTGAFVGLFAGMATVAYVATTTSIGFLWHNLIGAVAPLGLQLPQVGAMRFLVHDDFVERAAIADNGDGIHDDPYFRHRRDVRQGI
jgi:Na+/proline symporter